MPYMGTKAHGMVVSCAALFVVAVLFLFPHPGHAQIAGTGNIQGTVTDSTGAVVPKASVTLTDESTHVARKTASDNAGVYVFPGVPISTYDLSVAAPGFKTYEQKRIVLEVGSSIAINATLSVGTAEMKVEVQSEGLSLQTEDPTFKQTIDQQAVTEMPLNGRQMTVSDHPLRRFERGARGRLYRQQILLPDHLGFDCRRRWQHHAVAPRWRRQPGLHGQRQPALSVP